MQYKENVQAGIGNQREIRLSGECPLFLCPYPLPDSYRSRWSGMAFHSFLQRRFAPRKMVHLPSRRSRMTGRYLVTFRKKLFFRFCSRLPLSSTCRLTLSPCPGTAFLYKPFRYFFVFDHTYFYSSVSAHAYPFRRLSPPPSPTSGDGLRSVFYRFMPIIK